MFTLYSKEKAIKTYLIISGLIPIDHFFFSH